MFAPKRLLRSSFKHDLSPAEQATGQATKVRSTDAAKDKSVAEHTEAKRGWTVGEHVGRKADVASAGSGEHAEDSEEGGKQEIDVTQGTSG